MWREMGRSGTLHACRGDRQMAVGGLAEPSRNIKPLIPAPTWPVLTSTILVPPPLARRVLAAVTGPHASTAVYVFKRYRANYSCNEPPAPAVDLPTVVRTGVRTQELQRLITCHDQ